MENGRRTTQRLFGLEGWAQQADVTAFDRPVWLLQEEAVEVASDRPLSVDAVLLFGDMDTDMPRYTIRGNHTDLPTTKLVYNEFDLLPDPQYKLYWLFTNIQQALDR